MNETHEPSSEPGITEQDDTRVLSLSISMLRGSVMMGLYLVWLCLIFWSNLCYSPTGMTDDTGGALRICAASGMTCGLVIALIASRMRNPAPTNTLLPRLCAAILPTVAPACALANSFGLSLPIYASRAAFFVSGVGASQMLMLIGFKFCALRLEEGLQMLCLSTFIAAIVGLFLSKLPMVGTFISLIAIPPLVALAFHISDDEAPAAHKPLSQRRMIFATQQLKQDATRLFMQNLIFGTVFAMVQFRLLTHDSGSYMPDACWFCLIVTTLVFIGYELWGERHLAPGAMQSCLLSFIGAAIVPLGVIDVPRPLFLALSYLAVFGFFAYNCFAVFTLARTIVVHEASFLSYFPFGRLPFAGFVIGWVFMYFFGTGGKALAPAGVDESSVALAATILLTILVVVIIVNTRYSVSSMMIPVSSLHSNAQPTDPRQVWSSACLQIEEEYGLSARERDVFEIVARGRDNQYVCEVLYISMNTVKSHSQHIYQKMGIHSQQELISIVEERYTLLCEKLNG